MKALLIKEAIDFKRGRSSKRALVVGHSDPKMVKKFLDEATLELSRLGYTASIAERTSKFMTGITWEILIEGKITSTRVHDQSNNNLQLFHSSEPEQFFDFVSTNSVKHMTEVFGPWILLDRDPEFSSPYKQQHAFYGFKTNIELIEKFIETDFTEAIEDWDWIEITKKRLAILDK